MELKGLNPSQSDSEKKQAEIIVTEALNKTSLSKPKNSFQQRKPSNNGKINPRRQRHLESNRNKRRNTWLKMESFYPF